MISLDLSALPKRLQKRHHNAGSAALIARLAVDKRYQGRGYGEWLLVDALRRLLDACENVAFPLIVVDAKEGAADFYRKFGFIPFLDEKQKLFTTVKSVRKSFGVCRLNCKCRVLKESLV